MKNFVFQCFVFFYSLTNAGVSFSHRRSYTSFSDLSSFKDTNNLDDEILKCITLHRRVKLPYLRPLHSNDSLLPNKHIFLFELRYKSLCIRDEYLSTTK